MSGTQKELTFWEVLLALSQEARLLIPALLACSCEKAELGCEFLLRGLGRILSSLPGPGPRAPLYLYMSL